MKDKMRELAERWKIYGSHMTGHECADELLEILEAEGDGGVVPDGYTALLSDGKRYWSDKPGEYGEWRPYFLGDPVAAPPKVQP